MSRYMFRSLGSIIDSISNNHKLKKYFVYDRIKTIWKKNIDLQIQNNTEIINLNNDILIIQTTTPTWKTELGFQKTELLKNINKHLSLRQQIKDIKFI